MSSQDARKSRGQGGRRGTGGEDKRSGRKDKKRVREGYAIEL